VQAGTIIDIASAEIGTEELRASLPAIFGGFFFAVSLFIIIFIGRKIFVVFHDNIQDIIGDIKLILDTDFTRNRSRHTHPLYNNFYKP
jgi:hypothetical protein